MIEEIAANLYKVEIPLPKNPLRALNSYVVKGPERNLIIDTGWNQQECMRAMQAGLAKLGVDLRETAFFITHLHTDHLGLVSQLASDTSTIYFSRPDADRIQSGISWEDFAKFARLNGFPAKELQRVPDSHPAFKYRSRQPLRFHIVKEADTIRIADYIF
jgi:glyoxylase-like metal-dependent hydrolase (beta-lactamase superfamily II)